jgi:hypothetical protein
VRYWQHSLNYPARIGIDEDIDLCVMMDGLDVFPVASVERLHTAYRDFFAESREGIMFAGDTKCHPFCQEEGCWKWGNGHKYKMANGELVPGQDMCPRMAELSPKGPAKYICAGLFVGRCKLVRRMMNLVDSVIAEDGHFGGFFDQSVYQIMQLRYPELNMRVDSEMKYLQNWNDMGKERQKRFNAKTELFTDHFGVSGEDAICSSKWHWDDFAKKFGGNLLMLHFNGDSKVPLMSRCLNGANEDATLKLKTLGVVGATWVAPDLEVVMNCHPEDGATYRPYRKQIAARMAKQRAMEAQWYRKFPYAFKRGLKVNVNHKTTFPPDETKDQSGKGRGAYMFDPWGPIISTARGPPEG